MMLSGRQKMLPILVCKVAGEGLFGLPELVRRCLSLGQMAGNPLPALQPSLVFLFPEQLLGLDPGARRERSPRSD